MSFSFRPSIQRIYDRPLSWKALVNLACLLALYSIFWEGGGDGVIWSIEERAPSLEFEGWESHWMFFHGEFLLFSENKLEKNLTWKNHVKMCFFPLSYKTATKSNHIHPTQGNLPRSSLHNWPKDAWVLWNSPGNAYSTQEHNESNGGNFTILVGDNKLGSISQRNIFFNSTIQISVVYLRASSSASESEFIF